MHDDRGTQIELLFHKAMALGDDERSAFLLDQCGDDSQLRREVETLIKRDQLQTIVPESPVARVSSLAALTPDTVIDQYRIIRLIARGGFGEVYLAQQMQPVKRQVALKILKPGMDSREVVTRFEAERQALAVMDHPGIAHVFDSGATENGRPYFVMEYVAGVPIDRFCDTERLEIEARLRLFIDVCHTVHHAHQKGVIHRDLKPSNILVQFVDGRPSAKVIDFGIAKAIGGGLSQQTIVTQQSGFIGTPQYMSPEQAEAGGLNVDIRTDVYSLGVVLYELLVGMLPLDADLAGASIVELPRAIRAIDPARPSTRLRSRATRTAEPATTNHADSAQHTKHATTDRLEDIAKARRATVQSLMRTIRGDLDWITMKALEKERSRRYDSANEFAADVERHFRHEPVDAGPPAVAYRLRKFVRRNKALVTAGIAVGLVLLLGIIGTTTQWVRAQRQVTATAVINDFLREIIVAPDPVWTLTTEPDLARQYGPGLTVAQALTDVLPMIDDHFSGQPAAEADVRFAVGRSFSGLSRFHEAEKQLARAMELHLQLYGENDPRTRETMRSRAFALMWANRPKESENLYRRALASSQRELGEDAPETITSKLGLAVYYMDEFGEAHKAEVLCREAIASLEVTERHQSWEAIVAKAILAFSLNIQSRSRDALPLAIEATDELHRRGAERSGLAILLRMTLGNIYTYLASTENEDELEAAERHYRSSMALAEELAGKESFLYATGCQILSNCLLMQRKWQEAEEYASQAYETHRANMGATHGYTQTCWHRLTVARLAQSPDDPVARRELMASSQADQEYASESLFATNYLVDHFIEAGRRDDAALVLKWAETLAEHTEQQGRPEVIRTRGLLGKLHAEDGRCEEALELFEEAESLRQRIIPDVSLRADILLAFGRCEMETGQFANAEPRLIAAFNGFAAWQNETGAANAAAALVSLYETTSRLDEAERWRIKVNVPPTG